MYNFRYYSIDYIAVIPTAMIRGSMHPVTRPMPMKTAPATQAIEVPSSEAKPWSKWASAELNNPT